ncbi:MAG: hypothetical protein RR917_04315 [Eggerthellaceae bacterium]
MATASCWALRGCDEEMMDRCPHNIPGEPCPADCHFAACHRGTHKVATDFNLLLNPELNYNASVKEVCHFCEFFLKNGPAATEDSTAGTKPLGNPNRFLL